VAVALIAGFLSAAACGGQAGKLTEHTLLHQGQERSYLLYTPRSAAELSGKRPLVVALHGGAGTHRAMVLLTRRGFHSLADRDGFFVVYPNAVARYWDFGEGQVSAELPQRADDLGYFRAVLDAVSEAHPIDPRRVFATGISRGGQASYFLACKLPGWIRAIAAFTMPLPDFLEDDCAGGPPVGVAIVNGTADPQVPYDGGRIEALGHDRGTVLSTEATAALWRRRNGCAPEPGPIEVLDAAEDGTRVEKTAWTGCSGAPVVVYRVEGGGHTWPSGVQYLPEGVVGKVTRDVDGATLAWEFFRGFE
jgi:polyhydroxybutyrate depolymerase